MKKILILLLLACSISGLSQTLPNVGFPTSESVADTYTVNITNYGAAYNDKVALINFRSANGGPATLNITPSGGSALGAKPLRKYNGTAWVPLASGDLRGDSSLYLVHYANACGCLRIVPQGSGSGGGLTVGSTTITSGTNTKVLYDNSGTLGEYTVSGSGNVAMTTSPVFTTPNIGSATGSISGNAATVTTNANLTGPITSSGNTTSVAAQTGTGSTFVMNTSPTLVTPLLGTPTSGNFSSGTFTWPTFNQNTSGSAATLTTPRTIGTVTGDATSAGSSFDGSANNTNALTLATVNSDVGTFGSSTAAGTFTVNAKGLITAASNTTITPAVGSITGLGTGVGTWLATPSWTNFNSAITGTAPYWATSGSTTVTTPTITGTPTWAQSSSSSTNTFQTYTQAAHTGGTPTGLLYTGGAHTTLANASTADLNFNLSRTVQFGQNTTLALQTAALFDMSSLLYSSSAATKTITKAIGVQIRGVPAAGTNAAITNAYPVAVTDASDVVEVSLNQHSVNFGALVFGSVSKSNAPSIGAATTPTTFNQSGTNMRFQSGSTAATGRAGFSFASTSSIGFPSGTSTNSWIYSNTGVALSNSGATATHNHLDMQPSAAITGATLFTMNVNNIAPTIDINAAVTAAVIRGTYYNPTQTTVGSNTINKAWEHTSGYVQWNSVLTPSQITSNQNDYNPNGWTNGTTAPNGASILRLSTDASRNITSLAGGLTGRLVEIANVGSFNIVFTADDGATGTAANRFVKTTTLYPNESVLAFYDGTANRWMINGRMPQVPIDGTQSTYTNYTTTATYQNVTSVTLPAGEWELSAFFTYSANSATITAASDAIFAISTTTASAAGATEGKNIAYVPQAALLGTSHFSDAIAPYRVSPTTSTTYYLNTQATFTLGNPQFVGSIHANPVK